MNQRGLNIKTNITLQIQGLSHEGRGIAKTEEGRTGFIFNALPGEQVEANMVYRKQHWFEAEALTDSVQHPHPQRQVPPCDLFGVCGGCELQHFHPDGQLDHKQKVLLEQLAHFGKVTPKSVLPPLRGPTEGYRHKARLGVKYVAKKGSALVGFRERQGRFLVDMDACPVLHPRMGLNIGAWRTLISGLEGRDQIPQLELSVAEHAIAVVLRHLKPLSTGDLGRLKAFAEAHAYHLYLQPKGPDTVHLLWPEQAEPLFYNLPTHGIQIQFGPLDFTQVNRVMNEKMLDQALKLLDLQPQDRVLDLFCGLGNFTLPIARYVAHAHGIEVDAAMIQKAKANAALNGLPHVEFSEADLFNDTLMASEMGAVIRKGRWDKVLLDPPRAGAEQVCHELGKLKIPRVVYVSCNPATLARDVGTLVHEYGYVLESAGVMDMFPHTAHIEAMALLTKK